MSQAHPQRSARGHRPVPASIVLHATLLVAAAVALFPIVWVTVTSLKSGDRWSHPEDFSNLGLANYQRVLEDTAFLRWLGNSVVLALGTTLVGVFIAASAGYAVSRMRFPGKSSLMWTFLVVQMFPVAVLIVPLYTILSSLHLLDTYGGLILVYCTVSVPFCAWMLKGYFDTIPPEIDEVCNPGSPLGAPNPDRGRASPRAADHRRPGAEPYLRPAVARSR